LAMADGTVSTPVLLSSYASLTGPVGNANQLRHPILQTVRIPLSDFPDANLAQVRGVRLTFDDTPTGVIYVANIRLSALSGSGTPPNDGSPSKGMISIASPAPASLSSSGSLNSSSTPAASSSLTGSIQIQRASTVASAVQGASSPSAQTSSADTSEVDLVVRAHGRKFTVGDALPILEVGDQKVSVSRYGDGGDTSTLIFRTAGAPRGRATLRNGKETYSLGEL